MHREDQEMINRAFCVLCVFVACCLPCALAGQPGEKPSDPMKQLSISFPGAVELKNKGRLLEFCPDNTCHGFATSRDVSVTTLKDFAYLYVYFF
jgi:hypothetical protein